MRVATSPSGSFFSDRTNTWSSLRIKIKINIIVLKFEFLFYFLICAMKRFRRRSPRLDLSEENQGCNWKEKIWSFSELYKDDFETVNESFDAEAERDNDEESKVVYHEFHLKTSSKVSDSAIRNKKI